MHAAKLLNKTMNHTGMDHSTMNHTGMDHSSMGHTGMDHSSMGHDMGGMVHDMGMMMSFHGGYKETILFDFWETKTVLAFVLSCLGLFVCAALYEGLKLGREKLMVYEVKRREKTLGDSERKPTIRARLFSRSHLCQTLLHMLQITVSYLLMLVFMTYNSYLCLSVVLGAGLGYFIFGFQRVTSIDVNEHCH